MEPRPDSVPEDPRGDFDTARDEWDRAIIGSVPQLETLQAQLDALTARVDGMTKTWTGIAERLDGLEAVARQASLATNGMTEDTVDEAALEDDQELRRDSAAEEADLYRAWTGRRS